MLLSAAKEESEGGRREGTRGLETPVSSSPIEEEDEGEAAAEEEE